VPVSDKEVGKITTVEEKILLRQLNQHLVETRIAKFLKSNAASPDLGDQQRQVNGVVNNCYLISDAIKSELRARTGDIKANCVHLARSAIRRGEVTQIKDYFDATLWNKESQKYLDELPGERSILAIMRSIGVIKDDDLIINLSDVTEYVVGVGY